MKCVKCGSEMQHVSGYKWKNKLFRISGESLSWDGRFPNNKFNKQYEYVSLTKFSYPSVKTRLCKMYCCNNCCKTHTDPMSKFSKDYKVNIISQSNVPGFIKKF